MIKQDLTDKIASTYLGKKVEGSVNYDSSLLVAVPRINNRLQYDIFAEKLPFDGADVWHAYEFSTMTEKGLPITRVLKLKYPCDSEFIVESKSLKLYLNSFNMSRFGVDVQDALNICADLIKSDLSKKLKTNVEVCFLDNDVEKVEIFKEFINILSMVDEKDVVINEFKEAPQVLKVGENSQKKAYYLTFDSLRSNCRVTHQPDFGDVFIYYNSKKHIEDASLVQYLSSFRSEYHFHEECCEMIYKRLWDLLDVNDELLVCALYTRRGGIDICPVRFSSNCSCECANFLLDLSKFARCGIKQ